MEQMIKLTMVERSDPIKVPKMSMSASWGWNLLQNISWWMGVCNKDAPWFGIQLSPSGPRLKYYNQRMLMHLPINVLV